MSIMREKHSHSKLAGKDAIGANDHEYALYSWYKESVVSIMREKHSHSKLACKDAIGADDHEYALYSWYKESVVSIMREKHSHSKLAGIRSELTIMNMHFFMR